MQKMKKLLMMALAVFVGTAFAADPVATWTDFSDNTLTSGEYTLTKDAACTVNPDGSITLGGAGLTVPYSGSGVTVVMEVSNINIDDHTLIDYTLKGNNNHISLFTWSKNSSGATLEQWWNKSKYSNNEESGSATWPTNREERRTVALTYAAGEGTTTYINGVMLINNNSLMSSGESGNVSNIYIGSYNHTEKYAVGMTIHSLRLYSTKLSAEDVKADYYLEGAQWMASFNGDNATMGWITSWGGEAFDSYVGTPNGKGGVVENSKHPWSSYNVSTPFTVALYANVAEISNNNASLLALGDEYNYVALIKTDSDTIEVWKGGSRVEGLTITDTDFAVHSSYHLIVFGNDAEGSFLQINDQKVTAASIESPVAGLQIGAIYKGVPNGIRRAYGLVVDEVRGFNAKLNEKDLMNLQVKFPKYLPPEQKIEVEGEVRCSNLEIQEGSRLTINVKSGSTLILDEEVVTLESLHIETEGTLDNPAKIDLSAESDPFDNVGNVSISGTGAELIVDIYNSNKVVKSDELEVVGLFSNAEATADEPQEVSTKIAIASDETLKTKGYLNFTAANTIAGTLEVVSGVTTFNLARVGLSGTVKVAAGATFKNGTNDGPHYSETPTLDIAGTLEVTGGVRWSLGRNSKTILRDGAVLKGTGENDTHGYAYDYFDGATVSVEGNATIEGNIGAHNAQSKVITLNVAEGKTLTIAGSVKTGTIAASGAGTVKLASENSYSGGTKIPDGSKLVVASANALGTGSITLDGTLTFKDVEAELGNAITQTVPNNTTNPTGQIVIDNSTVTLKGANGNYKGLITINEGATLKTETIHYAPFGNGASIVNNGTIDVKNTGTGDCAIQAAISGKGALTVSAGTLILTGANTYNGATTIAEGAKVIANSDNSSTWDYVSNGDKVRELDITVNGELEIQSSGELYRGFAGAGKIVINADAMIGNTGDPGFTSGLSRFTGTLIVAAGKTLTLTTWGNQYDITLNALEVNGTVIGVPSGKDRKPVVIKTSTLSGSGTISGVNTFTLADGATLAGPVTVTGNVTVEGALTITHADEAGDTVITCANAEAVAARLTGAPQGLKYVAENGAVKLALAKVTVTLPAVQNAVWKDAEGNTITSIEVDPNSSASVKLETTGDYVFADGSTSMDVTIASGDADSEATAPADALIVAAKAKIGETLYASVGAACEAAADGATIVLLQDLAIAETKVMNFNKTLTLDFNGTEQTATADPAILVTAGNLTLKNGAIVAPGVVIQQGEKGKEQTTSVTIAEDMILGSMKIVDEETGEADGDNVVLLYGKATLVSEGQLTSCSKEYATIQGSGGDKGANTSITINGGFVYQLNGNVAIYQPQAGTVTINDGEIMGGTGIEMRNGTLTVNGGTITAGANYAVNANGNGSTVIGAAIAVSPHAGVESITANINGGTIGDDETAKALAIVNTIDAMPPAISATIDADATINMDKVEVDVSDMEFKENENDDGYTLGMKTTGAIIKNEWYETLQAAINAATEGDTVILLGDVTASEIITIEKAITLNGNGKTLTYTGSNRAIEMPNNAEAKLNVTLKNLTVDCTASYCQRGINYNDDGALVLNNVTVKGTNVTYALNLPGYSDNCVVEITDSSLTGNIALNVWGENATINATNTAFTAVDNNTVEGYAAVKLNNDGTTSAEGSVINIVGGKIDVTGSACADTEAVSNGTATGDVNISDTTVVNGKIVEMVAVIRYAGGTSYSFYNLADAFAKAQAGDTIILLRDVNLSEILTINKAITLDGNGKTLTSTAGRAINVSSADGVTIKNLKIDAKGERAINIIQNATNVTIENVTATAANYTVNVASSAGAAKVAITGSTLTGLNVVNVAGAGADITINGGKITCNDQSAGENYAALFLNSAATNGKITATDVTFDIKGDSKKASNGAEGGVITIDGKTEGVSVPVAIITYGNNAYTFTTLQDAVDYAQAGETIKVIAEVNVDAAIEVAKKVTIDLNGKTIAATENDKVGDGVFCVVAGGELTINDSLGTGVINGVGGNNYNIAIWANGGKVTINGGNFTNVGATDNTDPNAHFDLIYVKNSGEVVINGGTFECETPAFTLNSHDTYKGVITVNGGTFVGFDPRNNAAETAGTTFMAAGKYTFAEGGNYIVVTPEDYILNGVASNSATVGDVDSLLAGAVTVTKDGEKYVATATYTFKVTAVDTINPEKSSYELTGGKLRPGKTVAVKYIDLATGTEAWEKPESDTVTFKLVIK